MNWDRTDDYLGAGTQASNTLPKLLAHLADLGATRKTLTMGRFDFNRRAASEPTRFGRDGIIDVSPDPKVILNAFGNANSNDVAGVNRDVQLPVALGMAGRVVEAHNKASLLDGQVSWEMGWKTGHGESAEAALRELKRRLPRLFIAVTTVLPNDADRRDLIGEGYQRFQKLKEDGIITVAYVTDNSSPFALRYTLDVQDQFSARAFASLSAAQVHFTRNRSFGEVASAQGDFGTSAGLAVASRPLSVRKGVPGWNIIQRWMSSAPDRGTGDVYNAITEAQIATNEALTNRDCLLIEDRIDYQRKPIFICYTVPFSVADRRAWLAFSGEMRRWLANTYPAACPLFVSGSGVPMPGLTGSYWLQASVFFSLPDIPGPVRKRLHSEGLARRSAPGRGKGGRKDRASDGRVTSMEHDLEEVAVSATQADGRS